MQTGYYPTALAWGAHPHDDGLIYVADSFEGLIALRYHQEVPTAIADETRQPEEFSLEQNHPNPFNSGTNITFSVVEAGEVELSVYNLMGQRVTVLFSGFAQAGSHVLAWDGRDDSGNSVASGVYAYRLMQGDQTEVRRLMLLK